MLNSSITAAIVKMIIFVIALIFGVAAYFPPFLRKHKYFFCRLTTRGYMLLLLVIGLSIGGIWIEYYTFQEGLQQDARMENIHETDSILRESNATIVASNQVILQRHDDLKRQNEELKRKIDSINISHPEYIPASPEILRIAINNVKVVYRKYSPTPYIHVYSKESTPIYEKIKRDLTFLVLDKAKFKAQFHSMPYIATTGYSLGWGIVTPNNFLEFSEDLAKALSPYLGSNYNVSLKKDENQQFVKGEEISLYILGTPLFSKKGEIRFE